MFYNVFLFLTKYFLIYHKYIFYKKASSRNAHRVREYKLIDKKENKFLLFSKLNKKPTIN